MNITREFAPTDHYLNDFGLCSLSYAEPCSRRIKEPLPATPFMAGSGGG